jgi:hypothetical protein
VRGPGAAAGDGSGLGEAGFVEEGIGERRSEKFRPCPGDVAGFSMWRGSVEM